MEPAHVLAPSPKGSSLGKALCPADAEAPHPPGDWGDLDRANQSLAIRANYPRAVEFCTEGFSQRQGFSTAKLAIHRGLFPRKRRGRGLNPLIELTNLLNRGLFQNAGLQKRAFPNDIEDFSNTTRLSTEDFSQYI